MVEEKFEILPEGEQKAASQEQENFLEELLAKPNVVGVGVGYKVIESDNERETGDICLSVFVTEKLTDDLLSQDDMVKPSYGKVKTDVVTAGEIFAGCGGPLETEPPPDAHDNAEEGEDVSIQILRNRVRPVEGGYSVGNFRITAGTYATAVYDSRPSIGIPRRYYVLSNNHVLANSNRARIGDPILQPGPIDGGRFPRDMIARLSRFVPIRFGGARNLVDAAIAEGAFHVLDREIYWIGYVKGVRVARLGSTVQKTGRTTNYTTGRVRSVNAVVNVNYGGGRVARFSNQIVTTPMSAGGDSGSLLCDVNEMAVGLLFAGSASITIHNDIRRVQALLGIRIV